MIREFWTFIAILGLLGTSQSFANDETLIKKLKNYKCQNTDEASDRGHILVRDADNILEGGIAKHQDLMKETLKVVFCGEKYDKDFESVEFVKTLAEDQTDEFNKALKTFSKADQDKFRRDLKRLQDIWKNGNG